jgi:hypothetical protein
LIDNRDDNTSRFAAGVAVDLATADFERARALGRLEGMGRHMSGIAALSAGQSIRETAGWSHPDPASPSGQLISYRNGNGADSRSFI